MATRRRTQWPGLQPKTQQELIGLQDDLIADAKTFRDEAVGTTTGDKTSGTYGVRFSERVRCQPVAAGLDLVFPKSDPVTLNRWIEVLHLGGGEIRCRATSGNVQGAATLTLVDPGLYVFRSDGIGSWWTNPIPVIPAPGIPGVTAQENGGANLGTFTNFNFADVGTKVTWAGGAVGSTLSMLWGIAPGSLELSDLVDIGAQSYLGNPTGGAASAQAIAVAAESVVGRTAGNLGQITSALQSALIRGAGSVFWGTAAANQVLARLGGDLGFQNISALGLLSGLALQVVTATGAGTYTPTAGMKFVLVIGTGAGGGSGGADVTNATAPGDAAAGGGGGAGGTCIELFSAATIGASQPYSVGVGGTAGANTGTAGGTGGNTTFGTAGALFVANGGNPGSGSTLVTLAANRANGGLGGTPTGGALNIIGGDGADGWAFTSDDATAANELVVGQGGHGGASFWGDGARAPAVATSGNFASLQSSAGVAGRAFGSGASGAVCCNNTAGAAGAVGANGVLVFLEFT